MTFRPVAGEVRCDLPRGVGWALAHNSLREQIWLSMGIARECQANKCGGPTLWAALSMTPATTVAAESAVVQLENTGLGHRTTENSRFNAHTDS